mgnify:CR=1 FL=1|jgi:hypothetical protein
MQGIGNYTGTAIGSAAGFGITEALGPDQRAVYLIRLSAFLGYSANKAGCNMGGCQYWKEAKVYSCLKIVNCPTKDKLYEWGVQFNSYWKRFTGWLLDMGIVKTEKDLNDLITVSSGDATFGTAVGRLLNVKTNEAAVYAYEKEYTKLAKDFTTIVKRLKAQGKLKQPVPLPGFPAERVKPWGLPEMAKLVPWLVGGVAIIYLAPVLTGAIGAATSALKKK